ncbi:hypothetical protein ES703_46925 [subsurface metagenome]
MARRSVQKFNAIVLATILLSGCAFNPKPHPRDWTKEEKAAAVTYFVGHGADTWTTFKHQNCGGDIREGNQFLGEHPNDLKIGVFMATCALVVMLVAHGYPELRKPLLFTSGGWGLYLSMRNLSAIERYGD